MFDDVKYPEVDPNKKTAVQIWEERYAKDTYLFGKEPIQLLKTFVGSLKKGKAIDIACGEGRNAAFLAQEGFEVEGIDCSAKAIEKAKRLAAEKNVELQLKTQNLDFFLMPLMKYDTIVMSYLKPLPRFFSEIRRGLVMGGTFLLEAYTVDHLRAHPNPFVDIDECYKPNEVLGQLKDFHFFYYKEMDEGGAHCVQAIAQKKRA